MRTIGLIFSSDPAGDGAANPTVAGISVLDRQARLLRRGGCEAVFAVDVVPLTVLPAGVEAVAAPGLDSVIGAGDRVLAIAAGLIVDERAIDAMLAAPVPALLVADATRPGAQGVERLDALTFAAGLATIGGTALRRLATTIGDWDLHSTLVRTIAGDAQTVRIEFSGLPVYAPSRRRDVPLLWARPRDEIGARAAADEILAAAQKGCLDWPARYLHPPVENALTRALWPTAITPNMVTLATGVIGIAALVAFALGWLWTGLILALVTGPLDGVDGKLARSRIEFSKWGDLEHLLDKILEYGWYLAIAGHFAAVMGNALPWAVAALIILPALAEAVQGEFFRRMTGFQLDDAGPLERRIRLVAGRRNTFLWSWLPFAAAGWWFAGFVMIAAYSIVTTGVAQWRFYTQLSAYGRQHGDRIAANYAATGYAFLPKAGVSSN